MNKSKICLLGLFLVILIISATIPALSEEIKPIPAKQEDFKELWDDEDFKKIVS